MSKTIDEAAKAYAVPAIGAEDVVSTICRIVEEDSPRPMRGMKKSNRVPNAADQFAADHHGEYEARGQQSQDPVGIVQRHNQACPKMYDELEKRRSVVAVVMKRKEALQLRGSSRTLKRHECRSSNRRRRRRNSRRGKNRKTRTARNRLSKRKNNARRILSSYRLSKIWKSKGCQIGTSELKNDENWTKETVFERPSHTSQQSNVSEATNKRLGGSQPSVSSYHSFYSTDHEPMVS